MKKEKIFKDIDLIMYFNILMFSLAGIQGFKTSVAVGIILLSFAIINIIFIIQTIRFRINYNNMYEKKQLIESQTEEAEDRSTQETLTQVKQRFLENLIETEIKEKLPDAKIIKDAYVPKQNNEYSQIDLIVIATQGIFLIEAKNISGKITCDWAKDNEMQIVHPNGKIYQSMNPIKQNHYHFQYLKNCIKLKSDIFRNIVVFGDQAHFDYKNIPFYARICHVNNLIKSMLHISAQHKTMLESHHVVSIYESLNPYIQKTNEKEKKHIESISNKQKSNI